MKWIKKLLTGILAATLVFTMNVTAFATDSSENSNVAESSATHKITVNDTQEGQIYYLYKVLDYVPTSAPELGAYKLPENGSFNNKIKELTDYVSVDKDNYVTWVKKDKDGNIAQADADAFAKELQAAVPTQVDENGKTIPQNSMDSKKADGTSIEFTGLDFGYYMVYSSLGSLVSLNTTTPDGEVDEKNDVPDITKEVEEDGDGTNTSWGENNDAEIGQIINYRSDVTIQPNGRDYKVTDIMTEGLTFQGTGDDVFKVNVLTKTGEAALTKGSDYSVEEKTDGFVLNFSNTYIDTVTEATTVRISYQAKLNENAEINTKTNDNEIYLEYGNNTETEHKYTHTKTYPVKILKYDSADSADDTKKPLAGAEFTLQDAAGKYLTFKVNDSGQYVVTGKADAAGDNNNTKLTSGADGSTGKEIVIIGLDSDTYTLTETKAPATYNALTEPKEVRVLPSSTLADNAITLVEVPNSKGTLLPRTGGIGTTIFYVIGGLLIVAGAAYFIVRRKADAE